MNSIAPSADKTATEEFDQNTSPNDQNESSCALEVNAIPATEESTTVPEDTVGLRASWARIAYISLPIPASYMLPFGKDTVQM